MREKLSAPGDLEHLTAQEWLVTNGIGGFASGTVGGCATRRYHSLLTVALDPPSGRRMSLLGGLDETVVVDGAEYPLATHRYADGTVFPAGWQQLERFDALVTEWRYRITAQLQLTKEIALLPDGDAVAVTYRFKAEGALPGSLQLRLAPLVCWKEVHATMARWPGFPSLSQATREGWCVQATNDAPTLHFRVLHGHWEMADWWNDNIFLGLEAARGFSATESLYCPATVTVDVQPTTNKTITFVASVGQSRPPSAIRSARAATIGRTKKKTPESILAYRLHRNAEQFLVHAPEGRSTVLAGYPWFTDWGRDTFIALPGLCLTTGRAELARQIVRDFVPWVRNGRIPNRFPDDGSEPGYNNVDGTLWFVRCIGLLGMQDELGPTLQAIVSAHRDGSAGDGIRVDNDGLLRCGNDHTNLTWMDAKVEGVAITPRFDRPVEIQALWINALRVAGEPAAAERATAVFLERFVRADGLGLYDCLLPDGSPDRAIRPNQVIAAALMDPPPPVCEAILRTATEHLLTPYGLRTLSPADPRFCPRYEGDYRARDSAYHQGTVWPWLIGSFCDLYQKVHGPDADLAPFLTALEDHFTTDYGLDGIAEVFDGAPPYRPNGCPWQAWSLAEVLRVRGLS